MGTTHVALCSGGADSVVATHAAMRWGPCEVVMYLDTGGANARENQDFVREFCREYGWHLIQWQTPESYEELVKRYGFPGPSKHEWFYRYLKERQISKFATLGDELHFWTGVHRAESEKRMQRVVEREDDQSGRWVWHAPLADWQPEDFDRYREEFDLPKNDLWGTLGRSGDCWCGAYANRMELIDAEAAGLDDVVENIRGIEDTLSKVERGFDDERRSEWAWHDDDPSAWAMDDVADGKQMMLCSDCGPGYPKDE